MLWVAAKSVTYERFTVFRPEPGSCRSGGRGCETEGGGGQIRTAEVQILRNIVIFLRACDGAVGGGRTDPQASGARGLSSPQDLVNSTSAGKPLGLS